MHSKFWGNLIRASHRIIDDFLGVIYPNTCEVCGDALLEGEKVMCLKCLTALPRKILHGPENHSLAMKFAGLARIRRVASFFVYSREEGTAELIKKAKYGNQPQIAYNLAKIFASELMTGDFFAGIDGIVPVPMHWFKQAMRGYNQCDEIAKGVSEVTGIEVIDNLISVRHHKTQTRKTADERKKLESSIFRVIAPEELDGKHLLVVDDVITTGTTVISACKALLEAQPSVSLSILSLAKAH